MPALVFPLFMRALTALQGPTLMTSSIPNRLLKAHLQMPSRGGLHLGIVGDTAFSLHPRSLKQGKTPTDSAPSAIPPAVRGAQAARAARAVAVAVSPTRAWEGALEEGLKTKDRMEVPCGEGEVPKSWDEPGARRGGSRWAGPGGRGLGATRSLGMRWVTLKSTAE